MAEHRGDGFQAHAPVDGLGGQGVPQLVGVDVAQPGRGAGFVDEAGDRVPVHRAAVLPGQEQGVRGVDVRGAVVVDQRDQVRVQRKVAVFAELADRDVQPRAGADVHHRIGWAQRSPCTRYELLYSDDLQRGRNTLVREVTDEESVGQLSDQDYTDVITCPWRWFTTNLKSANLVPRLG